jgi:2-hydroxychromene-2-carboxylate isomerase
VSPVTIRHFTDPACPFAFSAERQRHRLLWLYGDQIEWELHMIVLREEKEEWRHSEGFRRLQLQYGMPIDWRERVWLAATVHACRAVIAARLRWPDRADLLLRRLRVLTMAGALLDDSDTLELAAEQAGLPVAEIAAYCAEPEVEEALRADMRLARGHRCSSHEVLGGDLATLERRPDPKSVDEVLRWAPYPLATTEVAAVCEREITDVAVELARLEPAGADGYWALSESGHSA